MRVQLVSKQVCKFAVKNAKQDKRQKLINESRKNLGFFSRGRP